MSHTNAKSTGDDLLDQAGPRGEARDAGETPTKDAEATAYTTGILPSHELERQVRVTKEIFALEPIEDNQFQPASIDLRLGPVAYRVRASFLPGKDATVEQRLEDLAMHKMDISSGGVLERGCVYIVPLLEGLSLRHRTSAMGNPKSSTGRLDVFTRVITDNSDRFDEVADGYTGNLYLEVVPLSFAIRVREDLSLNQLRLSVGRPELSDAELRAFHQRQPLLFRHGEPVAGADLAVDDGLFLSLDLRGDRSGRVGYRARDNAPLLDMTRMGGLDADAYWEHVKGEEGDRVVLTPQRFYLLMSDESVTIPPDLAAEMMAYDPTSGELRTHYAGFFDPGFGYDSAGLFKGSRAALEVRAHDVPFMIEHGQRVCKLTFERMLAEPDTLYGRGIGSSYQQQEETLGKHFLPRGDDQLSLGDS